MGIARGASSAVDKRKHRNINTSGGSEENGCGFHKGITFEDSFAHNAHVLTLQ
jgi:hypothetical protein